MESDLRRILGDLAPAPASTPDFARLIKEGRRRRHRRMFAYATASLAVLAISVIVLIPLVERATKGDPRPPGQPASTGDECVAAERAAPPAQDFVPEVDVEDENSVMRVVFSDGTTAELIYPTHLDLSSLGVSSIRTSGVLAEDQSSSRGIVLSYGVPAQTQSTGDPLECYEGAHGQVEVWATGDAAVPRQMFVPLHSWTAVISDGSDGSRLSSRQERVWAASVAADQRPDGWIVLREKAPLRTGPDYTGNVSLELGRIDQEAVLLWPVQCEAHPGGAPRDVDIQLGEVGGGQAFASWCDEGGPMEIHAYGSAAFIRDLSEHLTIRNVRHASDPGNYHIVP